MCDNQDFDFKIKEDKFINKIVQNQTKPFKIKLNYQKNE